MKKLKLAPESLEVTSFEPLAAERRGRGTVQGASEIQPHTNAQGCVQFTGVEPNWCTGPACDYTLAISCIPDNCMSHERVICQLTDGIDC